MLAAIGREIDEIPQNMIDKSVLSFEKGAKAVPKLVVLILSMHISFFE